MALSPLRQSRHGFIDCCHCHRLLLDNVIVIHHHRRHIHRHRPHHIHRHRPHHIHCHRRGRQRNVFIHHNM